MKQKKDIRIIIEQILFSSKWMLIPFYVGLMIALANFIVIDIKEISHFLIERDTTKSGAIMFILELIDIAMIAALVRMIIIGGYTSFICKNHSDKDERTSSGVLKVKLGTAIIGVSSINLLQTFMSSDAISWDVINKQLWIHGMFLMGAIVLAVIDYLHVKAESIHNEDWNKHLKSHDTKDNPEQEVSEKNKADS